MKPDAHPFLRLAHWYNDTPQRRSPEGCTYDIEKGYWWIWEDGTRIPLVLSSNPARPRPETKKADRETGEDQKGT